MNTFHKVQANNYYRTYYSQLVGLTVINVHMAADEGGDAFPVLLMARDDGKGGVVDGTHVHVTLSRDPEGNGAGHAFIEPMGF